MGNFTDYAPPSLWSLGLDMDLTQMSHRQAILLLGSILLFVYYIFTAIKSGVSGIKAPFVGYGSYWEPTWFLRLRFVRGSEPIIREGYAKFKDSMFILRRNDKDILVISHRNVDHLRNLPEERISAIEAHIQNLLGHWSTTHLMLEGDLHTRTLQKRLTPTLGLLMPALKDELDYALRVVVPDCQDWTSVNITDILLQTIARISARIFVGPVTCRDQKWIHTTISYTENVFITVMALRLFPSFVHPILAPLLPSYWRLHGNLATANRVISPMVRERIKTRSEDEKNDDFLQWMINDAKGIEGRPDKLAHRQLILSLASIHTTGMAAAHAMYDLCAHPEYFDPLRAELLSVLKEDGGWHKATLNKLKKLDSFLKESQRLNPPSQLAFNRVVKHSPLELYDGTVLPVGTHFNMASHAILLDAPNLPNSGDPAQFDGFRYSRLREDPGNANKYQWATTDNNSLHFGHGKYACPGRFLASNEIKLILAHLILRYDFKYPEGSSRPRNLTADENFYPDPAARLLMRAREDIEPEVRVLVGLEASISDLTGTKEMDFTGTMRGI